MNASRSPRLIVASILADIRSGTSSLWTLADQGIISLGSFLVTILLARAMDPSEYGLYVLMLSAVVFANSIQASLISYPLIVRGATLDGPPFASLVITTLLVSSGIAASIALLAAFVSGVMNGLALGLAFGAAVLMWQMQQITRSAFIARSRYRDASMGDGISYLGQAGIIVFFSIENITVVFAVMAFTSFAALLLQAWQLHLVGAVVMSWVGLIKDYWILARWSIVTTLSGGLWMQALVWSLVSTSDTSELARYYAVVNVLGLTNPIILGLRNVVLPTVAVSITTGTVRDAGIAAFRRVTPLFMLQASILLCLWAVPSMALSLFYGPDSTYIDLALALRWLIVADAMAFGTTLLGSVLDGIGKPKYGFFTQIAALVTVVVVGVPVVAGFGAEGASAGYMMVILVKLLTSFMLLSYLHRASSREGVSRYFNQAVPG